MLQPGTDTCAGARVESAGGAGYPGQEWPMEPISPATSGHGRSCLESVHGGKASSNLTERVLTLLSNVCPDARVDEGGKGSFYPHLPGKEMKL